MCAQQYIDNNPEAYEQWKQERAHQSSEEDPFSEREQQRKRVMLTPKKLAQLKAARESKLQKQQQRREEEMSIRRKIEEQERELQLLRQVRAMPASTAESLGRASPPRNSVQQVPSTPLPAGTNDSMEFTGGSPSPASGVEDYNIQRILNVLGQRLASMIPPPTTEQQQQTNLMIAPSNTTATAPSGASASAPFSSSSSLVLAGTALIVSSLLVLRYQH